ncbi:MAG TPA: hypothetical protein VJX23_03095 [Candidatus Binataceae bacterium]|nr:hypothetical protein [Candidatus Binataceae bacterium]
MLKWIPMAVDLSPGLVPKGLWPVFEKDFQAAWFMNLFRASLQAEPQGYLDPRLPLGMIAGAHSGRFWESHKAAVLARFDIAERNGVKYLVFPPLLEVLNQQVKKQRTHRAREEFSEKCTPFPQECGDSSLSQSAFDFECRAREENDGNDRAAIGEVVYEQSVYEQSVYEQSVEAPGPPGKRAQRVERDRAVLRESLRRYGG